MIRLSRSLMLGCSSVALVTTAFVASAYAEDTGDIEQVGVTGTSIRGIAPVGSNLITVGAQEIDNMGAQNITQVMANMPAIEAFGSAGRAAASASNGNPGTAIYIHQLGANGSNSTLVLLDGQRFPWSGDTNYFVDPNNFPAPMIERVEVDAARRDCQTEEVAGSASGLHRHGDIAACHTGWELKYDLIKSTATSRSAVISGGDLRPPDIHWRGAGADIADWRTVCGEYFRM